MESELMFSTMLLHRDSSVIQQVAPAQQEINLKQISVTEPLLPSTAPLLVHKGFLTIGVDFKFAFMIELPVSPVTQNDLVTLAFGSIPLLKRSTNITPANSITLVPTLH